MVLSNKKLKKKLRAAIAESATAGATAAAADGVREGSSGQIESLKRVLNDGAQKRSKLSKREKRRKVSLPSDEVAKPAEEGGGAGGGVDGGEVGGTKKKQRKRKSGDGEGRQDEEVGSGSVASEKMTKKRKRGDGGSEEKEDAEKGRMEKENKVKKKKKKKKISKKKKQEGEGEVETETEGRIGENGVAEFNNTNESGGDGVSATKIYVGGIPYYSTEDDIQSFFESCGTITEMDCMSFPESGKFRGISIITFKTEAAAKRALALDGADMGGLFLKIQPYRATRVQPKSEDFAPKIVEGYNRIYVGNLSWDITEDNLKKFFSDCAISSIRFGLDKETGEFRGYAHVDFSDSDSLVIALSLDQKVVCGRPARIRCAVPRKETKIHVSAPRNLLEKESVIVSSNQKTKRRTCYQCGVPGHVSSSCPNKEKGINKSISNGEG